MKYKILMALMGLDIGGAETHVIELVKYLKSEGHEIIVASNGGVYEKSLEDVGIKHYKVPMHQRKILSMIKSYFMLKRIIKENNVDIVHSHARIPSFLCGLLHRKDNFIFVTSAHGVFRTNFFLKFLSNWGQKVLAVSDDIRMYLQKNYGVHKKDIILTINGIDTEKFAIREKNESVLREFGLSKDDKILLHVSRLDEKTVLTIKLLLEEAEFLSKEIKRLKIVVVGGGSKFEELKAFSDEQNKKIGYECIIMTGPRTDVNEIISVSDVFIGVSRAALEAMACGKTVVLSGNEGYTGIFDKTKLNFSIESNFCCRGAKLPNKESILSDVCKAFNDLTQKERNELGLFGREVVINNYSIKTMTNDCLKAYDMAVRQTKEKQYTVLMSGYYGFNNSGDEAILISVHKNIENLGDNIDIVVLSNSPVETLEKYGFDVVYRFSLIKVLKALKNCDLLLSGGGSLLQDTTSTRSLMYYLSIILTAKMFRKKVMLYANGIGPVSKKTNRRMVKWVVSKADLITLRENSSYEDLRSMGVKNEKVFVTADPVFTMDSISKDKALNLLKKANIPTDKPIMGVSVRNWKNQDNFIKFFAKVCDEVSEKFNKTIVFIVMHQPNDVKVSEKVQSCMKNKSYILKDLYSPYELIGMISLMDYILSMRLHTLIFAARMNIPLIGFSYDPKIEYYLEKLNMPQGGKTDEFDFNQTMDIITDVENNRQKYVDILKNNSENLEKAAHKNEEYLYDILKGIK